MKNEKMHTLDLNPKHENEPLLKWAWIKHLKLSEVLFCLCLLSVFLPVKIYPLFFAISAFVFLWETPGWLREKWVLFLAVFSAYAAGSFFVTYQGETFIAINFVKLLVNFGFLYFAVSWLSMRNNGRLLPALDIVLHIIFGLVFIQLMVYHQAYDFELITGSPSSGKASTLYREGLYFWGLDEKNMFGARIAMVGFPYILLPLIRRNKLSVWRILFIFLLAYLSLSRTPVVALLMGVFVLIYLISNRWVRVSAILALCAGLPFILKKILRIGDITSSNDGMGIRLTYWKAFFQDFDSISIWGNGFLRGKEFLATHAAYYRGEPHLHNTFLSCYLELGVIGLVSYTLFLVYFFLFCRKKQGHTWFFLLAFLPLLSIMMILYSGYDNDIVLYLILVYLLGSIRHIDFKQVSIGI